MYARQYRFLAALMLATALGFSVLPVVAYLRSGTTKDYGLWYLVGQVVIYDVPLYPSDGSCDYAFLYPPPAAILLTPLAMLGRVPMMAILVLLNSAAWAVSVFLSVRLATGRALGQHPMYYFLPSALCLPFIYDSYLLGQPNLLLLAMMLGAFAGLRSGRWWVTGLLIGAATALKAFPGLALAYLVYRRAWRAVGWSLATLAFFLVVVPAPVRGFGRNLDELALWARGMVFRYDEGAIGQRPAEGYGWKNQSLVAVCHRLLRPINAELEAKPGEGEPIYVNVADLGFGAVSVAIILAAGAIGLGYIGVMPPRGRRTPASDATEWAMLAALLVIASPYSYGYYCVWLLFPFAVAVHHALLAKAPVQRAVTVAWMGLALLLLSLSLPWPWPRVPQALGNNFWACLVVVAGLGWELSRLRRAGPAPQSPPVVRLSRIAIAPSIPVTNTRRASDGDGIRDTATVLHRR
jgi:hypothetical protein